MDDLVKPTRIDPTADLLARKGDEHERAYYERLRAAYGDRLVAFEDRPANTRAAYAAAEAESVAAMERGAEIVYQATLFDGTFLGRADFLRKVATPSPRFGAWSYEVVDTKLALSPKPYFLIQLCNYSEHLARIQGVAPALASIVLGSFAVRDFRIADFFAYYRSLKASYLDAVAEGADEYPFACQHCDLCAWRDVCAKRRDDDDHLSIVANIRRDQIAKLENDGIATVTALAAAASGGRPPSLRAETFERLRRQAAEQHRYRHARARGPAEHSFSFRERDVPIDDDVNGAEATTYGFARLPEPALGDVFFDMEGDPIYAAGRPLEYLFGAYLPLERRYERFWAQEPSLERTAFEAFVDFIVARRARFPGLHVFHYAPYETTALKRLMGRFGSREAEIDAMLRAGTFVDLYPIVTQSVFISQSSYSIKKVEALYGFARTTTTKAGDDSIVMFESWRDTGDRTILDDIERYNEEDCRSTERLRDWLVDLRAARNAALDTPIPWRAPTLEREAPTAIERDELAERLLDGIEAPASLDELRKLPETHLGRWLLGNVLHYHRRAAKPEWWEFFHRLENPSELVELDRKAIGGLERIREIEPRKIGTKDKNFVYAYRYPEQEHDVGEHDSPCDAATGKTAGTVVTLDETRRELHIKLSGKIDKDRLRALIPATPINTAKKRAALDFIAAAYAAGTLERDFPATHAMLLRRLPNLGDRPFGAPLQPTSATKEALSEVVAALDRSYLVVQGPPGSGKTTSGAHAIVDLLARGRKVALATNNHTVLHNLLHKIEETAARRGVTFVGCHKSTDTNPNSRFVSRRDPACVSDAPTSASYAGCSLVSGTTFAWADADQRGAFDVVVVDEAGQVSLADALLVSLVAKNVVLLGDPQQLPQVDQGTHPIGTDRSILEHLLDGRATIPIDRGVFLDTTYRLHPAIDRFVSDAFYDGRLAADARNARNRIVLDGVSHAGPRFLAVEHDGHRHRSPEEAGRIVDAIAALLARGRVVIRDDAERPLEPRDVLVVAPYNRQRREIADELRARGVSGVEVGTVDKFQGQEAPVVFYSLTTSRADLAPRGIDFLLNPNRLNVAVSRAQALSIVVASPHLLASRATSIEGMRLLSLLCAYANDSSVIDIAPAPARYVAVAGPVASG